MEIDDKATQEAILEKSNEVLKHLESGGTIKSLMNITEDQLEAIYSVAQSHFASGKTEEAIELFKFLCLYDHTNARWFYSLGVVQQRRKEYVDALQAYAMATLLDMSDPRPQAQAGYCLMALEKWPEARSALEGAAIVCGDKPEHAGMKAQIENLLSTIPAEVVE